MGSREESLRIKELENEIEHLQSMMSLMNEQHEEKMNMLNEANKYYSI